MNGIGRITLVTWSAFIVSPLLLAAQADLKNRADAGDAAARYEYSCALSEGKGCAVDLALAMKYAILSAEQNYGLSYHSVAKGYEDGWSGVSNRVEAAKWYKKFADWVLLEKKDPRAMWLFRNAGYEHWLIKAANGGDVFAMDDLARKYMLGKSGLAQDKQKSLYWFYVLSRCDDSTDKIEDQKIRFARAQIKKVNKSQNWRGLLQSALQGSGEITNDGIEDNRLLARMTENVKETSEPERLESFCGIKFGEAIRSYETILNQAVRVDEGKYLAVVVNLKSPFRGIGEATVYSGITSRKVFKVCLKWKNGDEKLKDGKEVDAIKNALDKRYGGGVDSVVDNDALVEVGWAKEKKWCALWQNTHELANGSVVLRWAAHKGGGYDYEQYNVELEATRADLKSEADKEFVNESGGDGSGVL